MMQTFRVRWDGTTPLMFHNRRLANPMDPIAKDIKKITSKRKKTDDDYEAIAKLEFQGGLYWDQNGAYVPSENIHAAIREAGKSSRQGENVKRGIMIMEVKVPLIADYPKNIDKLFESHADLRPVVVQRGTCIRCRPKFEVPWAIEFEFGFDQRLFDGPQQVLEIMRLCGSLYGFCEGRPSYGRFEPTLLDAKGNGKK